jgi:hypothetical protein
MRAALLVVAAARLVAFPGAEVTVRCGPIAGRSRPHPFLALDVALLGFGLAGARRSLARMCRALEGRTVGSLGEIRVRCCLISVRALLVAVARRLVAIRRRLILIARRLVAIRRRLVAIRSSLIADPRFARFSHVAKPP